jgi:hypothetical protein
VKHFDFYVRKIGFAFIDCVAHPYFLIGVFVGVAWAELS